MSCPSIIAKTKTDSMLLRFINGEKHHRFTAEVVGDHALPSTISALQKRHLIRFKRKRIKVKNRFGGQSSVMLYWLDGEQIEIVRDLLYRKLEVSNR